MDTHRINYFDVPRMTGCTHTASPDAACADGPTVTVPAVGTCTVTPAGNEADSVGLSIVREFSMVEHSTNVIGLPRIKHLLCGDAKVMAARIDATIREAVEAEREAIRGMESLFVCVGQHVYEINKGMLIDAVRAANLDRLRQQSIEPK